MRWHSNAARAVRGCSRGLRDCLDLAHGAEAQALVLAARRRSVSLHLQGLALRLPTRRRTWTTAVLGHNAGAARTVAARAAALATHDGNRRRDLLLLAV